MGDVFSRRKVFTNDLSLIQTVIAQTYSNMSRVELKLIFSVPPELDQIVFSLFQRHELEPIREAEGICVKVLLENEGKLASAVRLLKQQDYLTEAFANEICRNYPTPWSNPGNDEVMDLSRRGSIPLNNNALMMAPAGRFPVGMERVRFAGISTTGDDNQSSATNRGIVDVSSSLVGLLPSETHSNFSPLFAEPQVEISPSPLIANDAPNALPMRWHWQRYNPFHVTADYGSSTPRRVDPPLIRATQAEAQLWPPIFQAERTEAKEIYPKKEALNGTQKNIIEGTLALYFEDIREQLNPNDAIRLFSGMKQVELSTQANLSEEQLKEIMFFSEQKFADGIEVVHRILNHDEPHKYLNLETRNGSDTSVTKEAVIDYIHSLIDNEIKAQEEKRNISSHCPN